MKLELEDVQLRITRTEEARSVQVKRMNAWEAMYCLDAGFTQTLKDAITQDGREQVVSPDPYNVIGLAMRLIPSKPKIDVPPRDATSAADDDAEQVERWLTAMYDRVNQQQGSNFVDDGKLSLFKSGLSYIQALWIDDETPKTVKKKPFPILIRALNPLNVGFFRGPRYVEYAYHKYEAEKITIKQEYPDLTLWLKEEPKGREGVKTESNMVCVVDFWYIAPKTREVWHCVVIEDEFALKPVKTDYPFVPFIEIRGEGDGKSILHAIDGIWQYKCRLLSNIGTGVLWNTWPFFMASNENGYELPDITVKPLTTVAVPAGTRIDQVRPDVNLTVLDNMLAKVESQISQATFPGVLYGDAGNMQAGYGVNILSQAASGRVNTAREQMEMGLMWLNELVLALIEAFDDDDQGVELWGRDAGSEKLYRLCLYKKQIDGYYENAVQLKLNLPSDDQAKQTFGLRLTEGDNPTISKQTYRDKYLGIIVPADEQKRIDTERAQMHPEIQRKLAVLRFMEAYPETWESIMAGTPLIDIAYAMVEFALPPEKWSDAMHRWKQQQMAKPEMPPMGPPPGMPPIGGPPPSLQPPAMMAGPMGGGVPPSQQGQFSPENIGMMHHENPALFAQAMGQPLPPQEELNALNGVR